MTGPELLALFRSCDQQIASLFGQMISITFAMIAGTYYFLNRARLPLKLLAFLCYGIGMIAFYGMMLREANIKLLAINALAALPNRDSVADGLYQLSQSWLFHDTGLFINAAHYALWIAVIYPAFLLEEGAGSRLNSAKR